MKCLAECKVEEECTVCALPDNGMGCKLLAMGIRPGSTVKVIRQAPWGGALYVEIGGVKMAMRPSEAVCIQIA